MYQLAQVLKLFMQFGNFKEPPFSWVTCKEPYFIPYLPFRFKETMVSLTLVMKSAEFKRISKVRGGSNIVIQTIEKAPEYITALKKALLKELTFLHDIQRKNNLLAETITKKEIYISSLNSSIDNLNITISSLNSSIDHLNTNIAQLSAQNENIASIRELISNDIYRMRNRLKDIIADIAAKEERPTFMERLFMALRLRRQPSVIVNISSHTPNTTQPVESCNICMDSEITHAFIPCGHHCVCEDCANVVFSQSKQCPMCRGNIMGILRIY
jgi:uncharacterized protein YoxC